MSPTMLLLLHAQIFFVIGVLGTAAFLLGSVMIARVLPAVRRRIERLRSMPRPSMPSRHRPKSHHAVRSYS